MAKSSARTARTSGFALFLWITAVVIELFVVAFASMGFDEVADASPFGRPGTVVAAAVIVAVALAGTVVAWRGSSGTARGVTAAALFIAAGIVAMMVMYFMIAGGTPIILAILLAQAAFSLAMIGRAVLQSASTRTGS